MIRNYRNESESEIMKHGKEAIGHTFNELILERNEIIELRIKKAGRNKGFIGNLFQYAYYGIEINSDKAPDFEAAKMELKVAGYRKNKNETLSADQRLVLSSIDFTDYVTEVELKDSTLAKKCRHMLMFFYLLEESIVDRLQCRVDYMFDYRMFQIPKEDLKIIQSDYNIIHNKIKSGRACDISEADTAILSACRRDGGEVSYIVDGIECKALPRRFAFKNSYITYLLNDYIAKKRTCNEPKIKNKSIRDIDIKRKTFEEYVSSKMNKYIGKRSEKIAKSVKYIEFVSINNKNKYEQLALKMLGIDSNRAPYLEKTATTVKAIRISRNNHIDQCISFPEFKFLEIVEENDWIESKTYDYLSERRFLFIVFKENNNGEYIFMGYKVYYLSHNELDTYFRPIWEKTKSLLKEGFNLVPEKRGKGVIYHNPLPGIAENGVCHIRPHSGKRAYKFKDGKTIGDWRKDANEMPDGQWMTTQSFWINNTYVMKILDEFR